MALKAPAEAMLRSLIAKQLEAIPNIARLVERLRTDPAFRYYCGFKAYGNVPSEATYSRFVAKLEQVGAVEILYGAAFRTNRRANQLLTKKLLGAAKETVMEIR